MSLKNNLIRAVVCSDLMSRGIDCGGIDLVVGFDIPMDTNTFVHRSGRAGRFGHVGFAISIALTSEEEYLNFFSFQLKLDIPNFEKWGSVISEIPNVIRQDDHGIINDTEPLVAHDETTQHANGDISPTSCTPSQREVHDSSQHTDGGMTGVESVPFSLRFLNKESRRRSYYYGSDILRYLKQTHYETWFSV